MTTKLSLRVDVNIARCLEEKIKVALKGWHQVALPVELYSNGANYSRIPEDRCMQWLDFMTTKRCANQHSARLQLPTSRTKMTYHITTSTNEHVYMKRLRNKKSIASFEKLSSSTKRTERFKIYYYHKIKFKELSQKRVLVNC